MFYLLNRGICSARYHRVSRKHIHKARKLFFVILIYNGTKVGWMCNRTKVYLYIWHEIFIFQTHDYITLNLIIQSFFYIYYFNEKRKIFRFYDQSLYLEFMILWMILYHPHLDRFWYQFWLSFVFILTWV